MKQGIHPELHLVTAVCACGNTFETRSTHEGAAARDLQRLPPVLHRQAEADRHRRPRRALPAPVRQDRLACASASFEAPSAPPAPPAPAGLLIFAARPPDARDRTGHDRPARDSSKRTHAELTARLAIPRCSPTRKRLREATQRAGRDRRAWWRSSAATARSSGSSPRPTSWRAPSIATTSCASWRSDERARSRRASAALDARAAPARWCPRTPTTSATWCSRSAPAPAATRRRCSPPSCSACTARYAETARVARRGASTSPSRRPAASRRSRRSSRGAAPGAG